MCKKTFLEFYKLIEDYNDLDYASGLLRFLTSPTKSNLKVGTLVSLKNSKRRLKDIWLANREYLINEVSLSSIELRISKDSVLIYFYSDEMLVELLSDKCTHNVLKGFQYKDTTCVESCLNCLKQRFHSTCDCPNEIGIFLGYPLKDVIDFHCKEKSCKLNGYWKCYNDVESSRLAFEKFDREKMRVVEEYLRGA